MFDEEMRLLLRAALAPAEPALAAFRAWRARYDLDAIGAGPRRIIALVHANLSAAGCDDPLLPRLKGIRRFDWARNQVLLQGGTDALAALAGAGIDTLVLKGAAMIAGWYRDAGLRPLGDVDILVPTAHAHEAIDALAATGWAPVGTTPRTLREVHLRRLPAWGFARPGGYAVDLHWHMLHQASQPDSDAALWARSVPARIVGQATRVLCPEDQLFHTCAHGMQARVSDRFSWPADSTWILRAAGGGFDWDRVVTRARHARLGLPLALCLRFLARELALPVPAAALAALQRGRGSLVERAELRLRPLPPERVGRAGRALLDLQDFRRRTGDLIRRPALAALLPWHTDVWRLDGGAATVGYAIAAACRRPAVLRRIWLERPRRRLLARLDPAPLGDARVAFATLTADSLIHGWSEPEPLGRWSDGPEAVAAFRVAPGGGDLALHAVVDPFVVPRHPRLTVQIWANGSRVATWRFVYGRPIPSEQTIGIPAALARAGLLVLTFVIRTPCSPARIGHSPDSRRLGIYVRTLAARPAGRD